MPVINVDNPLNAASDAIGSYVDRKRQIATNAAAQAYQQKRDAQAQSNADRQYGVQKGELDERISQDAVQNARDALADKLAARKEADDALHQAREDAIAALREQNARDKNDKDYAFKTANLENQFKIAQARVKSARDVAEIHAAATMGAAQIRASAELQATDERERGADRRANARNTLLENEFTLSDATKRRGQDVSASTKTSATNATNGRAMAAAVLKLSLSKNAPKPPTPAEDTKFAQAVQQFFRDSPADRAKLISNPNVPAATRAYFQGLAGVLAAQPDDAGVPDVGDDDDETP